MFTVRKNRPALLAAAAALAIAATAALAAPAGAAAAPGWRIVSATNYLPSTEYGNGYGTVVALSAKDAWAFGGTEEDSDRGTPVAVHWNGTAWSRSPLPAGLAGWLSLASAPSASDIWALAPLNGYLLHYNGKSWSIAKRWPQTRPYPSAFTGTTAFSPSDVWVFGGVVNGLTPLVGFGTYHYNGKRWTKVTGQARNIVQASAVSARDLWAVGGYYDAYNQVDHFNGKTWRNVPVPSVIYDGERYVYAQSATSVWVDGDDSTSTGQPVLVHWNGKSWTRVALDAPADSQLDEIAGDGHGGINVVASHLGSTQTWVLHRSPSGPWTRTALVPGAVMDNLTPVPGTTSSWGAGTRYASRATDAVIWADGTLP